MTLTQRVGLKNSIRWNLFLTLGTLIFVCQMVTVGWLWYESKEQIDVLVDLTLSQELTAEVVRQEELEAIFALFLSTMIIMGMTLFLAYKAIKRITQPLELLQHALATRAADNLTPITALSEMQEITAITAALNGLFKRLDDTLSQERLFTADVAHELRTPLAGIRLHLELLERQEQINCRPLISRIDRLVVTVEQLLTLARSSQKWINGQIQTLDFARDIAGYLNAELCDMLAINQQTLIWQQLTPAIHCQADQTLLCLMIRNLVENASRYSPAGAQITIISQQTPNGVFSCTVMDEGPGIDEAKISQLTQAFYRMDRRHKGLGLGLSIVQRIVTLHGGKLELKNRHDGKTGTLAQVTLPAA